MRQGELGREAGLDLLKTVLVAGMISGHVIRLIAAEPSPGARAWSAAIDLVTFPGFLLAFGLGLGLSARQPRARSAWQRLRPALMMLLATYASSFGYLLLVRGDDPILGLARAILPARAVYGLIVETILSLRVLYGYSEFLASFFVLYLVIAVARPALVAIAGRPAWLLAACALGLASTLVTTGRFWPLVGTVIGHEHYASFPLLSYLPWFLIGIHLGARGRGIGWGGFALGLAATGAFALFVWQHGGRMPERFPPSLPWVVGPGLVLALYLRAAERLGPLVPWPGLLLAAGRHVLASLLLSNLAIFAIRHLWGWPVAGGWAILAASLGLFAGVTLWGAFLTTLAQRRKAAAP